MEASRLFCVLANKCLARFCLLFLVIATENRRTLFKKLEVARCKRMAMHGCRVCILSIGIDPETVYIVLSCILNLSKPKGPAKMLSNNLNNSSLVVYITMVVMINQIFLIALSD